MKNQPGDLRQSKIEKYFIALPVIYIVLDEFFVFLFSSLTKIVPILPLFFFYFPSYFFSISSLFFLYF